MEICNVYSNQFLRKTSVPTELSDDVSVFLDHRQAEKSNDDIKQSLHFSFLRDEFDRSSSTIQHW